MSSKKTNKKSDRWATLGGLSLIGIVISFLFRSTLWILLFMLLLIICAVLFDLSKPKSEKKMKNRMIAKGNASSNSNKKLKSNKQFDPEKLSIAENYYNEIVNAYSFISKSLDLSEDPIERLDQIYLVEEKINACDQLLELVSNYNSIELFEKIFTDNISYDDNFSMRSGYGKNVELSLLVWTSDNDFLSKAMDDLKTKITRINRSWISLKITIRKLASFEQTLNVLVKVNIQLSEDIIQKRNISELENISYSSVTKKSNYDKLGSFVVIDTETTGLSASKNEIIEIAAICFENWEPISCFQTLIKPKKYISSEISYLTGIDDDMVENSPTIGEVLPAFAEYISDKNIVGHNLSFDMKFLCQNGFDFVTKKRKYYDTLGLAKKILKTPKKKWDKEFECYEIDEESDYDVENHKLNTLCDYYNIRDNQSSHRALSDCLATGILFKCLVEERIENY